LYRRVLVERNIEIPVIKRLHPVIVELEIPRVARWRREGDDQRLLRAKLPIAVVIQDAGIAAGSIGNGGIEKRQLIRMLPESVGPPGKQDWRTGDEERRGRQALVDHFGCDR